MRVLIAGASGFLGHKLSAKLTKSGHEIVGLARDPEAAAEANPMVSRFYGWQAAQIPPAKSVAGIDALVNLVGEPVNGRWTKRKKRLLYESRITATRNLVSALDSVPAAKLINAGAVGFYGDRGEEELVETSQAGEGFLAGLTQEWEAEALRAQNDQRRVALVRLGLVFAADGGALKPMLQIARFGLGGPLGAGRQWWSWIHVEDALAVLQKAVEEPLQGVYNLTAPEPVRQKDFAKTLAKILRRPGILPAPSLSLRLILGEFADELLFSKRVLPEKLLEAGFEFRYPELDAALRQLLDEREPDDVVSASS